MLPWIPCFFLSYKSLVAAISEGNWLLLESSFQTLFRVTFFFFVYFPPPLYFGPCFTESETISSSVIGITFGSAQGTMQVWGSNPSGFPHMLRAYTQPIQLFPPTLIRTVPTNQHKTDNKDLFSISLLLCLTGSNACACLFPSLWLIPFKVYTWTPQQGAVLLLFVCFCFNGPPVWR